MAEAKRIYNSNTLSLSPFYQPPFIGGKNFWISYSDNSGAFGAHWHGEIEIIYLLPGAGRHAITVDGREHILEAGKADVFDNSDIAK